MNSEIAGVVVVAARVVGLDVVRAAQCYKKKEVRVYKMASEPLLSIIAYT